MKAALTFGGWLKRRRRGLGLTQKELAQQVGYAEVTLRKVEADELRPSRQMAEKLAEVLQISPEEQARFVRFARDELGGDENALPSLPTTLPPQSYPFDEHEKLKTALAAGGAFSQNAQEDGDSAVAHAGLESAISVKPLAVSPRDQLVATAQTFIRDVQSVETSYYPLAYYRRQLYRTPSRDARPSLLDGVPNNLIFVGRSNELLESGKALETRRPVVLWGVGGLGKSALAIEVAHHQRDKFPSGVLWLDCRGGPAFDILLERIAHFCEVSDLTNIPSNEREAFIRVALSSLEERCLLIWDNAEDIWEHTPVRQFIRNVLPSNCQVLITTRLDPEEAMWSTIELFPLTTEDMHKLFSELTKAAQVKMNGQGDLDLIEPMLKWLEGHPLALTLIVPLVKRRGLRRVWSDLQQRPLKGIDAAIRASYKQLNTVQREIFIRLSVFNISFEREAAQALLPEVSDIDDNLDSLQQRSLIQWDGARCAYHPLLRQFAYACLQETTDVRVLHQLAASYLSEKRTGKESIPEEMLEEVEQWKKAEAWEIFASRASMLVGSLDRLGYWDEIEKHLDQAQIVVQTKLSNEPLLLTQILNARATILQKCGHWQDAVALWDRALPICVQLGDFKMLIYIYDSLGTVYKDKGEWDKAIGFHQQALTLSEQLDELTTMAQAYNSLGIVHYRKGEWAKAVEFHQQALTLSEQLNDLPGLAQTYTNLGRVYAIQGKWSRAIEFHQQALPIFEQVGDPLGVAQTYSNLGYTYREKGEWNKGIEFFQKAFSIYEQLGYLYGIAQLYNELGITYRRQGEWNKAIEYLQKAINLSEQLGARHYFATTYGNLGVAYAYRGEWDKAISYHQQALAIKKELGDVCGMIVTYNNLGHIYTGKGKWEEALEFFLQELQLCEQLHDPLSLAGAYRDLGHLYTMKKDWGKALEFVLQALHLFEQLNDSVIERSWVYNDMGLIYLSKGEWKKALDYHQQALRIFEQVGNRQQVGRTYSYIGSVYSQQGEWKLALDYYQQALYIFKQLSDHVNLAEVCTNIGFIYLSTNRLEEAKSLFSSAYSVFIQTGSPLVKNVIDGLTQICGSGEAVTFYFNTSGK